MAQIQALGNFTNGSTTFTGDGTINFLSYTLVGKWLYKTGEATGYQIAAVGGAKPLTLASTYGGTTATNAGYNIQLDYTANRSYPLPAKGDVDFVDRIAEAIGDVDTDYANVQHFSKLQLLDKFRHEIGANAGIRAIWTFDEYGSATALTDLTGNAHALTLRDTNGSAIAASTMSPGTAGIARSLLVNGSNIFDTPDTNDLSFGNGSVDQPLSIIALVKPVSMTSQTFCGKYDLTTGATKQELVFGTSATDRLFLRLYDDSAAAQIGRYGAIKTGDIGAYHCYAATYNGRLSAAGITLYSDGARYDTADDNSGVYVAMESLGAKAGSYTTNAGGSKIAKANAHFAFLAIIAGELSGQQVKRISDMLLRWVGVTTAQYPAGTELVSNGEFTTDTTGWTPTNCTIASVSGGVSGNCLELTRTSGSAQYAQATVTGLTVGKMYRATVYSKSGTSGAELGHILFGTSNYRYLITSSTWSQSPALYFVATATSHTVEVGKDTATAGTMLFDSVSVVEVDSTSIFGVRTRSWMRNSVLSGSVSSGLPNFISAGTGLACNLSASSTPLVVSFAAGFDAEGQVDFVSRINEDITHAWNGLTANNDNYLYIDRNPVTGLLTFGSTTVNHDVRDVKSGSPSSGMHNLIRPEGVMYAYTSAWAAVQRVFVGKAVTDGSGVTSIAIYRVGIDWFSLTTGSGPNITLTDGATIEWDARVSSNANVTINGTGRTFRVRGLLGGHVYRCRIIQGSGGSKTITTYEFRKSDGYVATTKWQGGSIPTLSTTATYDDNLTLWYDETNGVVEAMLTKDFH